MWFRVCRYWCQIFGSLDVTAFFFRCWNPYVLQATYSSPVHVLKWRAHTESSSKRRFSHATCTYTIRQLEDNPAVIDGEWWPEPFLCKIKKFHVRDFKQERLSPSISARLVTYVVKNVTSLSSLIFHIPWANLRMWLRVFGPSSELLCPLRV